MKPGDAERMYDACVLAGLNPVPWQYEFLAKLEQQAVNEQFRVIVTEAQKPAQQGR